MYVGQYIGLAHSSSVMFYSLPFFFQAISGSAFRVICQARLTGTRARRRFGKEHAPSRPSCLPTGTAAPQSYASYSLATSALYPSSLQYKYDFVEKLFKKAV